MRKLRYRQYRSIAAIPMVMVYCQKDNTDNQYRVSCMEQDKRRGGRPRVITVAQLQKLERAFGWSWPVAVACRFAGVARQTFYDHERRTDSRTQRLLLQSRPEMLARRNICAALETGDAEMSRWWLSRRCGDFAHHASIGKDDSQELNEAALVASLAGLVDLSKRRAGGREQDGTAAGA